MVLFEVLYGALRSLMALWFEKKKVIKLDLNVPLSEQSPKFYKYPEAVFK
jgi:hypothetical protein